MWHQNPAVHAQCVEAIQLVANTKDKHERHELSLRLIASMTATLERGIDMASFTQTMAMCALYPNDFTKQQ